MSIESKTKNYPLNTIQLNNSDGGRVLISPYGAHVLSWVPAGGDERLFLSPKAEFRAGAAIRGGIPIIYPQFADLGNLPKHGFARNNMWKVQNVKESSATFCLSENETTWLVWPHQFSAEYSVHINNNGLEMHLSITNQDRKPIIFTAALHTYLRVRSVEDAGVLGLKGSNYLDSTKDNRDTLELSEKVRFRGEVDRIYLDISKPLILSEQDRSLVVDAVGFSDVVIWNPGFEKCALLGDMEPDGYQQFVCMEAAVIGKPVQLEPGFTWQGKQILKN